MNLPGHFKNRMREFEPLERHAALRIGGWARYWYEPGTKRELAAFLRSIRFSLPIFVVGAGSNCLFQDGLIQRIFVHLKSADFNRITVSKTRVCVGAGVSLARLVSVLKTKDLGGYEFLAGIPGTVGGALAMNAGARVNGFAPGSPCQMKDIVDEVVVLDKTGELRRFKKKDLKFSYRNSNLKSFIIVSARLKLEKADKKAVGRTIRGILAQRAAKQEGRYPSAGSFFKNPNKEQAAGLLIDRCDLKGFSVGGARVSAKHANFIINAAKAKSSDVLKLMEIVQRKVYNRFKIKLKPEVEIVN